MSPGRAPLLLLLASSLLLGEPHQLLIVVWPSLHPPPVGPTPRLAASCLWWWVHAACSTWAFLLPAPKGLLLPRPPLQLRPPSPSTTSTPHAVITRSTLLRRFTSTVDRVPPSNKDEGSTPEGPAKIQSGTQIPYT